MRDNMECGSPVGAPSLIEDHQSASCSSRRRYQERQRRVAERRAQAAERAQFSRDNLTELPADCEGADFFFDSNGNMVRIPKNSQCYNFSNLQDVTDVELVGQDN